MTPSPSRRGAALLLVIASIAVVTALTVDLATSTRVSVQLAANARDELKATYLAKSAVNLSRLILYFQQQLEGAGQAAGAGAALLGGQPTTSRPGGGLAGGLGGLQLGVRLWEVVPVSSTTLGFVGGGPAAPGTREGRDAFPAFGSFEGTFEAKVEDEDRKINLRQFDGVRPFHWAQTSRLAELLKEPRWDFLFDRDDANGIRASRLELFAALKDWIDLDETASAYTGQPLQPFESGFSDENAVYDRLPERYKAKNAPWDSLDELYLVAGVSDAFMAAFGDRLTVYPDVSATINVNTDDPRELLLNAVTMGGGLLQPAMLDPYFLERLRAGLAMVRPFPFLALTPIQFAQVLQALGVKVAPEYLAAGNAGVTGAFGARSSTFRIRATGRSGDVVRSLEAVVIFDRRSLGLERDLGRLIHWSEE
jgi:general secretion pathway protein K